MGWLREEPWPACAGALQPRPTTLPGAGPSLDLEEKEGTSPEGPYLGLCPAWVSPSGTEDARDAVTCLETVVSVTEWRQGLSNHLVTLRGLSWISFQS